MVDLLGRVQLVKGTPPAPPGKCVICGGVGDKDSEFIDFGFEIDFYGVIYFCMPCIFEATSVLGLVSQQKYEDLQKQLELQEAAIKSLQLENGELYGVLGSLNKLSLFNSSASKQSDVVEVVQEQPKSTEQDSRKSTTAKPRLVKQVNESGSSSVRNNDKSKKSAEFDL